MVAQMNLLPYQQSDGASINLLMQPLQQGLQSYRAGMDKQFEGERQLEKERLAQRADTRQQQAFDLEQQKAKVQQIAGLAQMADNEKDPARRQQIWGRIVSSHPEMASALDRYGANDHINGPKFLIAEARGYRDPLEERARLATIKNAEGQFAHQESMARLQHQLQLDLVKAKDDLERQGLIEKGRALGIFPPAQQYGPPVLNDGQGPAQGAGRFANPAISQPAQRDPYAPLVTPTITKDQEEADRRRRAGQTLIMGDPKGAAKIIAKEEDPKEYQTKDALWAERMARAEITMRGNIGTPDKPTYDPGRKANAFWPDDMPVLNLANSQKWREYQSGAREWIAALLRKDTGAAVTDTEWKLYFPTYFPQPGDGPEVQRQKLERRVAEARKLRASSGPAFDRMSPGFDSEMSQRMTDQDRGPSAPAQSGFSIRRLD